MTTEPICGSSLAKCGRLGICKILGVDRINRMIKMKNLSLTGFDSAQR
jgi:hypothetical protein